MSCCEVTLAASRRCFNILNAVVTLTEVVGFPSQPMKEKLYITSDAYLSPKELILYFSIVSIISGSSRLFQL